MAGNERLAEGTPPGMGVVHEEWRWAFIQRCMGEVGVGYRTDTGGRNSAV